MPQPPNNAHEADVARLMRVSLGSRVRLMRRFALASQRALEVGLGVGFITFAIAFGKRMADRITTPELFLLPLTLAAICALLTFLLGLLFPPRAGELISERADPYVWPAVALLVLAVILYVLI